ncbi:nucleotide exchange factor SIL1-like [Montipora capricornis]|uniref:nucleotide exchange factor SIL1-like n=1 Tax=Montipora capricornis TaxID=246305 RepID=UPI0035F18C58
MLRYFSLLVLLLSSLAEQQPGLVLVESDDGFKDSEIIEEVNKEHVEEDLTIFQPTADWQTIQPGQGIPPGLHVRMNLQTGKKEAKLMDGDDGSKYQSNKDTKQKFITIDKSVISKQHLKEALKDFRDKFHSDSPSGGGSEGLESKLEASQQFRSIDEIRKELEEVDLFVKKDIEIITHLVKTLNSSSSNLSEKEHALDELEYYVHQIDNARDLHSIGGLALVVKLMNSTEPSLASRATYVLGSAAQSNPQVQQAALKQEALPLLLRLLSKHEPMAVRKKAMYALSSLIRLFPVGQKEFLKFNGLDIFKRLFEEPGNEPLLIKAITLMTDILTEQIEHVRVRLEKQGQDVSGDISGRVPLLKMMVEKGWCQLIPGLLHTTENDTREKVLQALHVMVAGCKSEFQKAHVQDNLNRLKLEWLKDAGKQQDYDDSEYVTILAQLVTDLMTKLR